MVTVYVYAVQSVYVCALAIRIRGYRRGGRCGKKKKLQSQCPVPFAIHARMCLVQLPKLQSQFPIPFAIHTAL